MACSSLILVVLSFLLAAAQSHPLHDLLTDKGLPRGILPDTFKSFDIRNDGLVTMELIEPTCSISFSSEVSQLFYTNPIKATLTFGKLEFSPMVVMKLIEPTVLGPSGQGWHNVKKIVSLFPSLEPMIEFWSNKMTLKATVSASPFSKEKSCKGQSVEDPGAMLAQA